MKEKAKKALTWVKDHKTALAIGAGAGVIASGAFLVKGLRLKPGIISFAFKNRNAYKTLVVSNDETYIGDIMYLVNWHSNDSTPFAFAGEITGEHLREKIKEWLAEAPENAKYCVMLERFDGK